jgi:hypothetical protein
MGFVEHASSVAPADFRPKEHGFVAEFCEMLLAAAEPSPCEQADAP